MLVNKKISEYIFDLASDLPAPGGGSAAALTGALGAALLSMVCNLTIGKEEYARVENQVKAILIESESLHKRLTILVDEDASAFSSVIAAFKLPKESPEDIEIRSAAIQTGYKKAADVPFTIANTSMEVLEVAEKLVSICNPNVVSDVGVAVINAYACMESAVMNVNVNLPSIKDEEYVTEKKGQLEKLLTQGKSIRDKVYQEVNKILVG